MKERAKQVYITCGILFSAGVLLAGGFVHMLNDSNEDFLDAGVDNFPWAFAISGVTVACLMCFEIALERVLGGYMKKKQEGAINETKEVGSSAAVASSSSSNPPSQEEAEEGGTTSQDKTPENESPETFNEQDNLGHVHVQLHGEKDNPFSAIILTLALSVHSIIEGLGIGATTDISTIQSAFVAIAVHKGFTAFALAQGMISGGYWKKGESHLYFYLSLGTFIIVALIGIAIGWGVSTVGEGAPVAALVGVTSGSFIYVALIELIPEETHNIKFLQLPLIPTLTSFLAGYLLMTMLAIWA